jgi:Type III secretory pathway, lipoprotein EscJ
MHKALVLKIIVSVSLLAGVVLQAGCGASRVQTVKDESEANQIIDVLHEYGIEAYTNPVGEGERRAFEIMVEGNSETRNAAVQLMQDHCLPKPEPPAVEGGTIINSIEKEKQQEYRRTKINIESQLRKLPGVTCVEVNFVPPQERTLALNPYPSTASVLINYKTETFSVSKDDVAALVAKSVPALSPENVSVVIAAKPLRPLPENRSYQITRIALISGLGFATVLTFVGIVYFLQRKRRDQEIEEVGGEGFADEETERQAALLKDGYDFEDEEDDDGLNLP